MTTGTYHPGGWAFVSIVIPEAVASPYEIIDERLDPRYGRVFWVPAAIANRYLPREPVYPADTG